MTTKTILSLPVFPKFLEELEDKEITYSSVVYVHYQKGSDVEILLQPVVNTYIVPLGLRKKQFLEKHLKNCLMISKYAMVTPEHRELLPCVDTLSMEHEDFLNTLHYAYP